MSDADPRPVNDFVAALAREWGIDPATIGKQAPAEANTAAIVREQRDQRFKDFCPKEFRQKIDPTKIKNPKAWKEADTWMGEYPGLWLWSRETGKGKSRMLWRKFGQLHVERGRSVIKITGMMLGEEYHDAYRAGRVREFYRTFTSMSCVMLDDLDKIQLGHDGFESLPRVLRELFDKFYEHRTTVLVTANEPISFFQEQLGESAARRMREVCREIEF